MSAIPKQKETVEITYLCNKKFSYQYKGEIQKISAFKKARL